MCGPGESYSDVILRLVEIEAAGKPIRLQAVKPSSTKRSARSYDRRSNDG